MGCGAYSEDLPKFEYVDDIILKLDLPKNPLSPKIFPLSLSTFLLEFISLKASKGPNNGALLKMEGKLESPEFRLVLLSSLLFEDGLVPSILAIKWTTSLFSILLSVINFESSSKWPLKINLCLSTGIL